MRELLLELLSEEIPARMQARAIEDLVGLIRAKLAAAQIPAEYLNGYVTPRRLAVIATGVPQRQPDRKEERRGPRRGAPEQAMAGFLRAAGLTDIAQCEIRDTGRGEFYFAVIGQPGRAAAEILPEIVRAAMAELPWPKSMRYPASSLRWVRPLTSVICLFGGEVVPLALDRVPVGRATLGHRFQSPGEIVIRSVGEYVGALRAAHVIADRDERRDMIRQALNKAAAAEGVSIRRDPGLLDEVTGLVEYPVVLAGHIDGAYMDLPPEVLTSAMRTHQKYFSCRTVDGGAAPCFLFVANNRTPDEGRTIIAGNERVLRARLADARFFWDQDRKVRLEDRVAALKGRVYHAKLGNMYDKVERMELIAQDLALRLDGLSADVEGIRRAARLAKADLSTGMVGEFPELQGIMGGYYARHDGEDPRVVSAIAEHYKPLGPGNSCPTAPVSVIVALADKIDALTAFFSIGEHPTGSGDPFALRRAALGLIRIILENDLRISLHRLFLTAQPVVSGAIASGSLAEDLVRFVADRLKVHLRGQGVRHDLIAAAFSQVGRVEDDLIRLLRRVAAIGSFLKTDDGASLLTAYRRASNIVTIEERRDNCRYEPPDNPELLQQDEEKALTRALGEVGGLSGELLRQEQFVEAMTALATLRRPVDEFFEKVTVNTDAEGGRLRENRLRLLSRIRAVMNQVADFSLIEG